MAMKSPEATIDFLLTCIDSIEGKVDWDAVAKTTGWYKGGKFSRQAFSTIQKKYKGTVIGAAANGKGAPANAPPSKKKAAAKSSDEEGGGDGVSKTKTAKKRTAAGDGVRKGKKMKTEAVDDDMVSGEGEDDEEA